MPDPTIADLLDRLANDPADPTHLADLARIVALHADRLAALEARGADRAGAVKQPAPDAIEAAFRAGWNAGAEYYATDGENLDSVTDDDRCRADLADYLATIEAAARKGGGQ